MKGEIRKVSRERGEAKLLFDDNCDDIWGTIGNIFLYSNDVDETHVYKDFNLIEVLSIIDLLWFSSIS